MRFYLFLYVFLLSAFIPVIRAQYFSVEDIETGRYSYLKPDGLQNLQWKNVSDEVVYSVGDTLFSVSSLTGELSKLGTLNDLNDMLTSSGIPVYESLPDLTILAGGEWLIEEAARYLLLDMEKKSCRIVTVPEEAVNRTIHEPSGRFAYTLGNNFYISDDTSDPVQLSNDSSEAVTNGDIAYRSEFGFVRGFFWSPAGNYIAYYHRDEREVSSYPLVDITSPVATLIPCRYPMAGGVMEKTDLFVYSLKGRDQVKITPLPSSGVYMTNIAWSPDEELIYIQHVNRGQDTLKLIGYSAQTGRPVKEYFTETHPRYIEPQFPVYPLKASPGDFLYLSERSGFNHLYLFDESDNRQVQLTEGKWEVTEFCGTDSTERLIYFMANRKNPLEKHLYSLDRHTGKISQLTDEHGTHIVVFSHDMSAYIDLFSSTEVPRQIQLCSAGGEVIKVLLRSRDPLRNYALGETHTSTIKAGDGTTDIYYKLTKPAEFDPGKKYPLIVYVYGGPHLQMITDAWHDRTDLLNQYLAQRGYASLMIDCRGSDLRGRDFENIIYRQHGVPQLEDHQEAIRFLQTLPWVDTSRIGVHGWSYGGFMTINLMLSYPDVFKVGVAGGAVTDWGLYEVMYGERYMDTPAENPEGYQRTNLVNRAGDLKGKLLLVYGGLDDVVVSQNSLQFIQAGIRNNRQIDCFVYPAQGHNVRGEERVHLTRMITSYFEKNL